MEGVFHISSHILSRLPGGRAVEYKEIAKNMGELKVVPIEFAQRALVPMAGLRNMLVHFYADIDKQRLQTIIKEHRSDIEQFLKYIKDVLKNPGRLGLEVT